MKLSALSMVNRNAQARLEQLRLVDLLKLDGALRVTIDGTAMDDAMVALVRPFVERELRARASSLEYDLKSMGVHVDVEPATGIIHVPV